MPKGKDPQMVESGLMKGKLVPIDFSKIPVVNLCPKCGSEMTREFNIATFGRRWKCHQCGHEEKVKP